MVLIFTKVTCSPYNTCTLCLLFFSLHIWDIVFLRHDGNYIPVHYWESMELSALMDSRNWNGSRKWGRDGRMEIRSTHGSAAFHQSHPRNPLHHRRPSAEECTRRHSSTGTERSRRWAGLEERNEKASLTKSRFEMACANLRFSFKTWNKHATWSFELFYLFIGPNVFEIAYRPILFLKYMKRLFAKRQVWFLPLKTLDFWPQPWLAVHRKLARFTQELISFLEYLG